jgi:hypothetical protein
MTFKVGDRVVGNSRGFSHRVGVTGVVTSTLGNQWWVRWDSDGEFVALPDVVDLAPPIGKPITELNLQVGDVVVATDDVFAKYGKFTVTRISDHPMFEGWVEMYSHESQECSRGPFTNCLWKIVSRAADAKPPSKMHPDDFVNAVREFAADNGFALNSLKYHTPLGATYMWSMINPPPAN